MKINHALLSSAIDQQGPWAGEGIATNDGWVKARLLETIRRINWDEARHDILPFVPDADRPSIDLWTPDFFVSLVERLAP